MKSFILIISGLIIGMAAQAQETVICTGGDCLTSGYEVRDSSNDLFEVGVCNSGDCNTNGWETFRLSGLNSRVECTGGSCFGNGFQELNSDNISEILRNRTCVADSAGTGDCLSNGWEDEYYGTNARIERTTCTDGTDCRNGFIIETIVDKTASMEAEIANLQDEARAKRQEFRDYLREHKQINRDLAREIISLTKQRIQLKRDLRKSGGIQVIDSKEAVCMTPGGCFTSGYTLN